MPMTRSTSAATSTASAWSDLDEEILAIGTSVYKESNPNPNYNSDDFYKYAREELKLDLATGRIRNKIKAFKRIYDKGKGKVKAGTIPQTKDQKIYYHLKKVWGRGNERFGRRLLNAAKAKSGGAKAKAGDARAPKETETEDDDDATEETDEVNEEGNGKGKEEDNHDRKGEGHEGKKSKKGKFVKEWKIDSSKSEKEWVSEAGRYLFEMRNGVEGQEEWEQLRKREFRLYVESIEIDAKKARLVMNAIHKGF